MCVMWFATNAIGLYTSLWARELGAAQKCRRTVRSVWAAHLPPANPAPSLWWPCGHSILRITLNTCIPSRSQGRCAPQWGDDLVESVVIPLPFGRGCAAELVWSVWVSWSSERRVAAPLTRIRASGVRGGGRTVWHSPCSVESKTRSDG